MDCRPLKSGEATESRRPKVYELKIGGSFLNGDAAAGRTNGRSARAGQGPAGPAVCGPTAAGGGASGSRAGADPAPSFHTIRFVRDTIREQ